MYAKPRRLGVLYQIEEVAVIVAGSRGNRSLRFLVLSSQGLQQIAQIGHGATRIVVDAARHRSGFGWVGILQQPGLHGYGGQPAGKSVVYLACGILALLPPGQFLGELGRLLLRMLNLRGGVAILAPQSHHGGDDAGNRRGGEREQSLQQRAELHVLGIVPLLDSPQMHGPVGEDRRNAQTRDRPLPALLSSHHPHRQPDSQDVGILLNDQSPYGTGTHQDKGMLPIPRDG